jgi:hypothetical protein
MSVDFSSVFLSALSASVVLKEFPINQHSNKSCDLAIIEL